MLHLGERIFPRKEWTAFLGAVCCSLALLFSNNSAQIDVVKTWVLGGFGYALEKVSVVYSLYDLSEENRRLRRRSGELMLQNSRLKEAQLENQRLRALLAFKAESKLALIPAKVIGTREDGLVNAMVISAGERDGLKKNMAVVTAAGLLGKVFHVSPHHASVQLLLDRNFRVSAMIRRSRTTGIVRWTDGDLVELGEVMKRSDVKIGDEVITSGFSSIFPGGLVIGTVTDIRQDEQSLFLHVLVRPAVDFSRIEEVLVVKNQPVVGAE